jgi:predicted short-subunit dehydrogenase-like oxidoreductase (DUF2520 family)
LTPDGLGAVGFVGAGSLGTSLALALAARGAHIVSVTARRPERAASVAARIPGCSALPDAASVAASADLVLLAVPDDAILTLDAALPWRPGQTAVHFSGARGTSALERAAASGAHVAALHPLMIFPREAPDAAAALGRLAGCTWALTAGDPATTDRLESLVAALGGTVIRLREAERVPYHLAAVLSSNYVVALLGAAVAIWGRFGVDPRTALDALLPLLRASVENLATLGPASALAGPVARGDAGTVSAHLAWLEQLAASAPGGPGDAPDAAFDPDALLAAYRDLARLAIPLARARGTLSDSAAESLLRLLDPAT